jgi:sulfoacetaldehyde acetyltransferase
MPTRPSNRAANIWRPGLFGPCGYGFPSILGAKIGQPDVPVVGFAGDGAFGISMNEMTACGRDNSGPPSPWSSSATTSGVPKSATRPLVRRQFRRHRARPRYVLREDRRGLWCEGCVVRDQQGLTEELSRAIERQMKNGETTFIEVLLNQELGEPFRRDAMKKPVVVAGINRDDMRPQQGHYLSL